MAFLRRVFAATDGISERNKVVHACGMKHF
jgi:hypothetical protein